MSLTLAAVVTTRSGVPRPSQIKWCLLPVLRRSTGDGPVAGPPFSRVRESRPRTRATSRVRRPRAVRRAGRGAADRRLRPSVSGPGVANRSVRSRTRALETGVARRCPDTKRTRCPAGTTGLVSVSVLVTARVRAVAAVRSALRSRRPPSTAESSHDASGRIITSVTPDQATSTRSCYELKGPSRSLRKRTRSDISADAPLGANFPRPPPPGGQPGRQRPAALRGPRSGCARSEAARGDALRLRIQSRPDVNSSRPPGGTAPMRVAQVIYG